MPSIQELQEHLQAAAHEIEALKQQAKAATARAEKRYQEKRLAERWAADWKRDVDEYKLMLKDATIRHDREIVTLRATLQRTVADAHKLDEDKEAALACVQQEKKHAVDRANQAEDQLQKEVEKGKTAHKTLSDHFQARLQQSEQSIKVVKDKADSEVAEAKEEIEALRKRNQELSMLNAELEDANRQLNDTNSILRNTFDDPGKQMRQALPKRINIFAPDSSSPRSPPKRGNEPHLDASPSREPKRQRLEDGRPLAVINPQQPDSTLLSRPQFFSGPAGMPANPFSIYPLSRRAVPLQHLVPQPSQRIANINPNTPLLPHRLQGVSLPPPIQPQGTFQRSPPKPSEPPKPQPSKPRTVVCLHCHHYFWNDSCDDGEPCQNCVANNRYGISCERPKCEHFANPQNCKNGPGCKRAHRGDPYTSYAEHTKSLKRRITMAEKVIHPPPSLNKSAIKGEKEGDDIDV